MEKRMENEMESLAPFKGLWKYYRGTHLLSAVFVFCSKCMAACVCRLKWEYL